MDSDIVRVRRVIEIEGRRDWVQATLERSIFHPIALRVGGIKEVSRETVEGDFDVRLKPSIRPPLVYIAGKFGGATPEEHQHNVALAAVYRGVVATAGCYPICPHKNTEGLGGPTGFLDPADPKMQEFWYQGSIELLRRCDVLLLIPGWENSRGAKREHEAARAWDIPVVHSPMVPVIDELYAWLRSQRT